MIAIRFTALWVLLLAQAIQTASMHALTSLEDPAILPNPIKDLFHVKKSYKKNFVSRETFFIFAATSAKGQSKARNQ